MTSTTEQPFNWKWTCLVDNGVIFLFRFICVFQEFVSKLDLQPGQVVLDVGCGIGGSAFYMVKVRIKYSNTSYMGQPTKLFLNQNIYFGYLKKHISISKRWFF